MKLNIFLVSATLCLSGNGFAADTSKNRSSLREWATAVIYAVEQLPSIKAKNAERNSVSYRQAAASRPLFNPELSIGYDSGEDNGIGIGISQTIDWSNKREARFATARSAMEAAGANLRAFKAKLLADGLRALNEQHAGKSLSHFADQQVQLLERLILIVDRRLETGDMGLLDAELARLSFSESLQAVAQAERDFRSSQGRVESILGVALDVPNPVIPLPVKVDVKRLVDYARSLPTVEASFKTFQSTKNAIDSAKAQIRADPTIGFGVGKDGDESNIGVSFSMPLFVRNNFSHEVKAAIAESTAAEQRFIETQRLALVNLKTASAQYMRLHNRWSNWKSITGGRFQQSEDLLNQLWKSGDINTADYIFGLQQRMQALKAGITFEKDLLDAWITWLEASGQVDTWLTSLSND